MKQGDFDGFKAPETVSFSGSQFGFIVETFDRGSRNHLFSTEPVEDEVPVTTEHSGDFFHGFESGAHDLSAPFIEEDTSPMRRDIIPKELEVFFQQVGSNGSQVVAKEIGQGIDLVVGQVFRAFEEAPTSVFEVGVEPLRLQFSCFGGSDFIDGFA